MKKILLSSLVVSDSVFALSAQASGRINFDGEVVAQTCNVTVNGEAASLTPGTNVSLPHVTQGALGNAGDVTGETRFTIGLRNCLATPGTAAAFFEQGTTVDVSGRLKNMAAGGAGNVQLQLLDVDGSNAVINVGDASQRTSNFHGSITGGAADLPYGVRYYATGASTAGLVTSSVTYTIDYQ
jgi:major type 1 subunit fimbrin (pilin)